MNHNKKTYNKKTHNEKACNRNAYDKKIYDKKTYDNKAWKLCIITAMVIMLTGCGSSNSEHGLSAKNPQNITVWNYYNGAQAVEFGNLVDEFNSTVGKEKGIIVSNESTSSIEDLSEALNTSLEEKVGAKELPNIVQCYKDMAIGLNEKDLLVKLDDYVSKEEKDSLIDAYVEDGKLGTDKEWKLYPVAKSTEVFMMNKQKWDAFSEGTNTDVKDLSTWEGVAATAEAYYNWSGGEAFFGRDAFSNYMLVGSEQLGHPVFQEQTDGTVKIELDRETLHTLWNNYYIPYIRGYYSHTGKYRTDDVKLGKIIAEVGSTAGAAYFPTEVSYGDEEPVAIDAMVLPIPNFAGKETHVPQQGAGMAVIRGTEQEEYASILFLEWFTEAERNAQFAMQTGYLPVKKEVNSQEKMKAALEGTGTELSKVDEAVLLTAVDEMENSHPCVSVEFEQGYEARALMDSSMIDLAKADYEAIQDKIREGANPEEELEKYETEAYFDQWLSGLQEQLDEIMNQ